MFIKNIGIILIGGLLLLSPLTGKAAEDGEMAIYPANWDGKNELTKYWFIYNLDQDQEYQDQVVVENTGEELLTVKIYPVDALTTKDGAFALENEDEQRDDIGKWVSLSADQLELSPGEKKAVDFTIKIPKDVTVGEHIGGIIVENKKIKTGRQINLKTRVGVRMYETVPGEVVKKIDITNIKTKGFFKNTWSMLYDYVISYDLINEGNVQLKPKVDFDLSSEWFGDVFTENKEINGSIFPEKQITMEHQIDKSLLIGPYKATITVNQEGMPPMQISNSFWVWPWKIIVLSALVIIGILSWIYTIFSKQNEVEEFWPEEKNVKIEREKMAVKKKTSLKTRKKTNGKSTIRKNSKPKKLKK